MKTQIKNLIIACMLLISFISQAQTGSPSTESARVSFTVKNPTLTNKTIGFSSYDAHLQKITGGYGYGLNALGTHAVNLPTPVYIYEEKNGKKELLCVVTQKDDGKTFSINQTFEISREQYLDFARAEMAHKNIEKNENANSVENIAKQKGIKLVNVNIKGSTWLPSMAHVRYELPWGKDKQLGFSGSLSKFNGRDLTLPVGTKIYHCSDKFWNKSTNFTEKLVLTVDDKQSEFTVVLN
jgi:hypothetical protein